MNKSLIYKYCEVLADGTMFGVEYIWYNDLDGQGVLETLDTDGVHESFSCSSKDDFDLIISTI